MCQASIYTFIIVIVVFVFIIIIHLKAILKQGRRCLVTTDRNIFQLVSYEILVCFSSKTCCLSDLWEENIQNTHLRVYFIAFKHMPTETCK